MEDESIAPFILIVGTRHVKWSLSCLGHLTPQNVPLVRTEQGAGSAAQFTPMLSRRD